MVIFAKTVYLNKILNWMVLVATINHVHILWTYEMPSCHWIESSTFCADVYIYFSYMQTYNHKDFGKLRSKRAVINLLDELWRLEQNEKVKVLHNCSHIFLHLNNMFVYILTFLIFKFFSFLHWYWSVHAYLSAFCRSRMISMRKVVVWH